MKRVRDRFRVYIKREAEVMAIIKRYTSLGAEITRITPAPDGETYDRVLVVPTGEVKLEIQITEAEDFQRYGDVRLDLISAFIFKPGSIYSERRRIGPFAVSSFLNSISVRRYGKLYNSEADTLAFYVPAPVSLLWLYSMPQLKISRSVFVSEYGIMINVKNGSESWQSCFVAVPVDDNTLQCCGVQALP